MLYDFTARMHEDDIVYIHQRAQRAGIALKTKYSPLVDILYVPEGFSPRRTYFRIARRARVLYDFSAREARLIWNISTRGSSF